MKQYTHAKEFRNVITIDFISGCCHKPVYEETDICSKCGNHSSFVDTCPECYGEGKIDVLDDSKSMELRIDPPIKTITCPVCNGERYIEE